ncbi:hypothetical protein CVT26_005007 [Gymnopilus dilepis]|uniref:Uncharacterized protein n=1 Tax=Gymnopilus dilepis TaxID=231916 RepID=A0A409Y091_9AGAR|nr:hypothetical protein CVT26_005007 [Gymnopilus dilepis]
MTHFTYYKCDVPFGVTYEKIGTIQRRLAWPLHKDDTLSRSGRPTAWPLHKDDTLSRSGRPTGLNIYFVLFPYFLSLHMKLESNHNFEVSGRFTTQGLTTLAFFDKTVTRGPSPCKFRKLYGYVQTFSSRDLIQIQ